MYEIFCKDKNGNRIRSLTQWDVNQIIYIDNWDYQTLPVFHFCNRNSPVSYRVTATSTLNGIGAEIPNILLQESAPIKVYLYLHGENNDAKTICMSEIPVKKRPKPSEYIYVNNHTSSNITLDEIGERLDALVCVDGLYYSNNLLYLTANGQIISSPVEIVAGEGSGSGSGSSTVIAPVIRIGTVTTLDTGQSATASITGANGDYVLNLGLPKGSVGTPGSTPNLSIGTVTTLEPNQNATATITGTASAPILNLGIPKGARGTDGGSSSGGGLRYGVCSSPASQRAKEVNCMGFDVLSEGDSIIVYFTNAQSYWATESYPLTLNVNNTGAKSILLYGSTIAPEGAWKAGEAKLFVYNGVNWMIVGGNIADGNEVVY